MNNQVTSTNISYEIEYWNSEETSKILGNSTHYHQVFHCTNFDEAQKRYKEIMKSKEYEQVSFNISETHTIRIDHGFVNVLSK